MATPLLIAGSLFSAASSVMGARAAKEQSEFSAKQNEQNAEIAEARALRAAEITAIERGHLANRAGQARGTTNVSFAGGTVQLGSGSPQDALMDIADTETFDKMALESNLESEQFGFGLQRSQFLNQAQLDRSRGSSALTTGFLDAGSSLLGGATRVKMFNDKKRS